MSEGRPSRSGSQSWVRKLSNLFLEPQDQEQLIELMRSASERHILDSEALSIVEGALSVSQMQARDIMLPRSQVVMVSRDAPAEETLKLVTETAHSRFPVIDDDRDDVIGILLAKDLLSAVVSSGEFKFELRELLRPAVFIPESKRLNVLLREFRARRNHMAIVVDEYGGVAGIVTIENVLEQIVGEIEDEHDIDDDAPILQRNEDTYTIKALTMVEDFNEFFETEWSNEDFDTVGGYVMNQFGHLPERGEQITIDQFQFTVLRADNRRVYLLKMVVMPPENEPEAELE
ncbi:Magnesium and cobalt efflux protein CorC [Methylophaga thiooxydans]|uniref:Magnesium and cobalt efflux protein CorC n=2 Tax=Methylophaga thiooxydans TaxID=392484 RepID=C0N3F4_9GAMM|nr:transporter associated domain-containing protein [Methylophaga thiooxydans]EEF80715.1 CBS domain pair protein [Methylophaga thiooxydans DMS010]KGM07657.1 Magnesium and cobalt efflux protein CorC [Methylophaga thiooxydans]